jgi:hypothetical protein
MALPTSKIPTHGRNWQYRVARGMYLLRNIGSVDPANDGWIYEWSHGSEHITDMRVVLALLVATRGARHAGAPVEAYP